MKHLTEHQLSSVFHHALPAELEELLLLHLAKCKSCERGTEPAIERYRALRRDAAKMVPPPPHPWRDVWVEMERADAVRPFLARPEPIAKPRSVWTTGLAAGAVLCLVLLLFPRPDAKLRAETLLPKIEASFSHGPSRATLGLRVRTATATFVRPAILRVADRSDRYWRERFRAANYDWNDPLNPRAFSAWRNSLKSKSDRVVISPASAASPKQITIQTTSRENALEDASLTVDAASLLPVSARFVFAGDVWMEISVKPGLPVESDVAAPPDPAPPKSVVSGVVPEVPAVDRRAATELTVWLIADRLSDPTGEPVRLEIRREKQLSVAPYSLNAEQFRQLSASLQGVPGVDLRIPDSLSVPQATPDRDPLVNLSETIFSRAHLLADLAEHFPEAVEMTLTQTDRRELWRLRGRHADQLKREIQSLEARVRNSGANPAADLATDVATGSSLIEKLVNQAGRVNRSMTILSADRIASSEASLARPRLSDEIAKLKELANGYASSVAESLEHLQ